MGILFISHSSRNNDRAIKVRDWLREQGWRDTFLDLDPEHGLAPGQRWQEELKKAGERCSAVIVLVSPEWVASRWCVTEFLLASQLGKLIFPVLIAPTPFADLPIELTAHFQIADMSLPAIEADGLNRLRIGLKRAGLDPQDFPWPPPGEPNRPPYRGLRTLEEPDAAIFFGRNAQITKGLDALRRMRDGARERMLVVLGASGAGKSSFLRAGLLARLRRDEENFLLLPILRPERAALTGPTGLARVLGLSGALTPEAIAARFAALRAPIVDRLTRFATAGQQAYAARPPTLILLIDQGEELFAAEQTEAGAVFSGLAAAFAADDNLLAIVTIRSDSFAALQAERTLAAIPRLPFDLPALSPASFKEVIEGPGRLATPPIRIEPALTERLVADLDQADALPLLAFTLERLVEDYGDNGVLTLGEYQDGLGGLEGAIGKAVEAAFAAARDDRSLPGDRAELEKLARSAFIPWLLRLERADALPKRRVALMRELPTAARPLVRHFIDQRLLVTDRREDGETVVEVSHEAVLRRWRLLAGWIGEERETLARCEAVMRAAGDWQRDGVRSEGEADLLLVHRGERLTSAEKLLERDDLAGLLGADARAYLAACREAQDARERQAREEQERQVRDAERIAEEQRKNAEAQKRIADEQKRRTRISIVAACVAMLLAGIAGWQYLNAVEERDRAEQQLLIATSGRLSAISSNVLRDQPDLALLLAAEASKKFDTYEARFALFSAITHRPNLRLIGHAGKGEITAVAQSHDGSTVATGHNDGSVLFWSMESFELIGAPLQAHSAALTNIVFSPTTEMLATTAGSEIQLWDPHGRQPLAPPMQTDLGVVSSLTFSGDGKQIASAHSDGITIWDVVPLQRSRVVEAEPPIGTFRRQHRTKPR